jgi:hypothetical protein
MTPKKDPAPKDQRLEGKYANYFAVGYSAHEFIFDFGQNYSENDQAKLHTRIVTSPAIDFFLNQLFWCQKHHFNLKNRNYF